MSVAESFLPARIERATRTGGAITFVGSGAPERVEWARLHEEARAMAGALPVRGLEGLLPFFESPPPDSAIRTTATSTTTAATSGTRRRRRRDRMTDRGSGACIDADPKPGPGLSATAGTARPVPFPGL